MRLALLSNITVDLLAGLLKKKDDIYLAAGFDTWQQEMILPSSGLYAFKPEAVTVLLHANAWEEVWNDREKGCRTIDEWCEAFQTACSRLPGVPVFISSLDIANVRCHFGAEDRPEEYLENYLMERVQELHTKGCNIYILPVKEEIMNLGRSSFYSPKMWYVGSMPYSMKAMDALSLLISRYCAAAKGARKKCLAVDLDNTLWGGVIGEDGVNGIALSNVKEGARFKDAQRILKKMKEQGVMLAILSKNNPEDVEPVYRHPDMVLRHEDFTAEMINWESKCVNIRTLAEELNIGLDAFVFLDDNPAEREQMKAECPEVAVPDFPKDSSLLPDTVAKIYEEFFLTLEVTGEDRGKTAMYRAEHRRKADLSAAVSVEEFLKKLEMKLDFHRMRPEEEKRVTQLTNKTNQFNVTTKRYSEEEIHRLSAGGDSEIYTVHMADKYGDQGLTAVLIIRYAGKQAEIDTFLMSCRVMGRSAEREIMACLRRVMEEKGIETVRAAFVRSAKNKPVETLFESLGFALLSGKAEEIGDRKEYEAETASMPRTTGFFNIPAGEAI